MKLTRRLNGYILLQCREAAVKQFPPCPIRNRLLLPLCFLTPLHLYSEGWKLTAPQPHVLPTDGLLLLSWATILRQHSLGSESVQSLKCHCTTLQHSCLPHISSYIPHIVLGYKQCIHFNSCFEYSSSL